MKRFTQLTLTFSLALLLTVFLSGNVLAQDTGADQGHGSGFVDTDGDGYNDNAPDYDGDGIPNGRDADYTGAAARRGNGAGGFVDADGDGVNDNAFDADGDGIPNGQDPDFVRPSDGSGRKNNFGSGRGKGSMNKGNGLGNGGGPGVCDGTGPKGNRGKKSN